MDLWDHEVPPDPIYNPKFDDYVRSLPFHCFHNSQEYYYSHKARFHAYEDPKDAPDKIGLVGLSRDNPLHLLVPFCLSSKETMWIALPYVVSLLCFEPQLCRCKDDRKPITQLPTDIYCTDPIRIQSIDDRIIWLVPTAPLLPAFARGWKKLPNELKTHILGFNLIHNGPITSHSFWWHLDRVNQYLDTTQEFETISREVFYKRNKFKFFIEDFVTCSLRLRRELEALLPLMDTVGLIANLNISYRTSAVDCLVLFLNRLAGARQVVLGFRWGYFDSYDSTTERNKDDENEWLELTRSIMGDEPAVFATNGRVVFHGVPNAGASEGRRPNDAIVKRLEDYIRSRIIFQTSA